MKNTLLNPVSEMDTKSPERQKEELLKNDKYKGLPEVEALKEQEQKEKQKQQKNKDNSKPASTTNPKESIEANEESKTSNETVPEVIPSKVQLENQLQEKLTALKSEYNAKLNQLLASAKAEYKQVKSGEKEVSVSKLAKNYLNLGNAMEAECDARVYASIAYTENMLKKYNYDTSIIKEARQTYQNTKEERRQRLLDKLLNYI
ncbi:MAG: hypothetical protein FH758_06245 [Firmicutes bacterium]|nr:hypothetical protein [Bacillota bacterium]